MTQSYNEQKDYLGLHNLVSPCGATKSSKRLGRGESSGWGKTAGRGHKGQKSRKSGRVRLGFEGGQNPLILRLPKRGFRPLSSHRVCRAINLKSISRHFDKDCVVDISALVACGLLSHMRQQVKILAEGEVLSALQLHVHAISLSAKEKIEAKGGTVKLIEYQSESR